MNAHISFRVALLTIAVSLTATAALAQTGPFSFFALPPCRVLDTRGGPPFGVNTQRDYTIKGACGVPAGAKAISVNVTVVSPTGASFLTLWPAGGGRPNVSTINFTQNDPSLANGAIVGLGASSPDLSVFNSSGTVHVILDVTGYFQ